MSRELVERKHCVCKCQLSSVRIEPDAKQDGIRKRKRKETFWQRSFLPLSSFALFLATDNRFWISFLIMKQHLFHFYKSRVIFLSSVCVLRVFTQTLYCCCRPDNCLAAFSSQLLYVMLHKRWFVCQSVTAQSCERGLLIYVWKREQVPNSPETEVMAEVRSLHLFMYILHLVVYVELQLKGSVLMSALYFCLFRGPRQSVLQCLLQAFNFGVLQYVCLSNVYIIASLIPPGYKKCCTKPERSQTLVSCSSRFIHCCINKQDMMLDCLYTLYLDQSSLLLLDQDSLFLPGSEVNLNNRLQKQGSDWWDIVSQISSDSQVVHLWESSGSHLQPQNLLQEESTSLTLPSYHPCPFFFHQTSANKCSHCLSTFSWHHLHKQVVLPLSLLLLTHSGNGWHAVAWALIQIRWLVRRRGSSDSIAQWLSNGIMICIEKKNWAQDSGA